MKTKLLFLSIIIHAIGFSQNISVENSLQYDNQYGVSYWNDILGQDETGYYVLGDLNGVDVFKGALVEKIDKKMNRVYQTKINYTEGPFNNNITFRDISLNNGNLVLFYSGWDKEKKEASLHVRIMNKDSGEIEKATKIIEKDPAFGQLSMPNFSLSFSPDGSKLVVTTERKKDKKEPEVVKVQVFNTNNWELIWKKEYEVLPLAEKWSKNNAVVNNNGEVFIYQSSLQDNKAKYAKMHVVTATSDLKIDLNVGEFYIGNAQAVIDKNGNAVLLGTITKMYLGEMSACGHAYFNITSKGEILASKYDMFPAGTLEGMNNSSDKSTPYIGNAYQKKLIETTQGGYILALEATSNKKDLIQGQALPTYNYTRETKGVLVLSVDNTGNINWTQSLIKSQVQTNVNHLNFFTSCSINYFKGDLYIVWNNMNVLRENTSRGQNIKLSLANNKIIDVNAISGRNAIHAPMVTIINETGQFRNEIPEVSGTLIPTLYSNVDQAMAINQNVSFVAEDGIIIVTTMPNKEAKTYQYSKIKF